MSVVWAVARQMVAECIRMRISVVFLVLLAAIVAGLPFTIEGDSSVCGAVQAFVTYALTACGVMLGALTIFLSRSLSDEFVHKQLLMLMAKPLPRWQFLLGKWVGVAVLNGVLLGFCGLVTYGAVWYLSVSRKPVDEFDLPRLQSEVLTARHNIRFTTPDFAAMAEREFQRRLEQGEYDRAIEFNETDKARVRKDLTSRIEQRWRIVGPHDSRMFEFRNVLCDRSPESRVQLRYKADVSNAPPDEILRAVWLFGDRARGTPVYRYNARHFVGRYHTMSVPADCVGDDHVLRVEFHNTNPFAGEPEFYCLVEFQTSDPVELMFVVGSFEGNLARLLVLMYCKLLLLGSVSLLAATAFSFPVACLMAFTFYILAGTRGFIHESLDFGIDDYAGWFTSPTQFLLRVIAWVFSASGAVVPDFGKFDALEDFANGRNVSLAWVLMGLGELVAVRTTAVLGLAMLLFYRREVAEVSL